MKRDKFYGIDLGREEFTIAHLIKRDKTLKVLYIKRIVKNKPLSQKQKENIIKKLIKKCDCKKVFYG